MLVLALVAIVVFISGAALSRRGAPYNILLVTVHKLLALGSVVLLALAFVTGLAAAPAVWPAWTLAVVTTLTAMMLFASGAMLSGGRSQNPVWGQMHRIGPYLVVAAGLGLELLTGGSSG